MAARGRLELLLLAWGWGLTEETSQRSGQPGPSPHERGDTRTILRPGDGVSQAPTAMGRGVCQRNFHCWGTNSTQNEATDRTTDGNVGLRGGEKLEFHALFRARLDPVRDLGLWLMSQRLNGGAEEVGGVELVGAGRAFGSATFGSP